MALNQNTLTIIGLVNVIAGVVTCFFGFKVFRLYLMVVGATLGAFIGGTLTAGTSIAVQVLVSLGLGLGGALLFNALYKLGMVIAGLLFGLAVGVVVGTNLGLAGSALVVMIAVLGLLGAVLGLALAKLIIKLSTAFTGSAQIVYGVLVIIPGMATITTAADGTLNISLVGVNSVALLIAWAALGAVGLVVQLRQE